MLAKTVHHFVRFKDKGILHPVEGEVTGFNAVPVAEDFAEERTGAGGEFMIFRGVFQCGKNLGLSEGAGRNGGADGVEVHGTPRLSGEGETANAVTAVCGAGAGFGCSPHPWRGAILCGQG